jgi:CRP-like cAMP-binding protein
VDPGVTLLQDQGTDQHLYVLIEGAVEVLKDNIQVNTKFLAAES